MVALETIYYVIAGLAFTDALTRFQFHSADRPEFIPAWAVLAMFGSVAVRFVHGASTHFGVHKNLRDAQTFANTYERVQPLTDFVSFGVQACFFVVLAAKIHVYHEFLFWLTALFVWDIFWIALTLSYSSNVRREDPVFRALCQWIVSNLLLGAGLWALELLDEPQHRQLRGSLLLLLGGSAFVWDYWHNSDYYFGASAAPGVSSVLPAVYTAPRLSAPRVVVESPFAGEIANNVAYAKRCLLDCLKRGEAPIASHLLFTQRGVLLDSKVEDRKLGVDAGHAWITVAERLVVYVNHGVSPGMEKALNVALHNGVEVEFRVLDGTLTDGERADFAGRYLFA